MYQVWVITKEVSMFAKRNWLFIKAPIYKGAATAASIQAMCTWTDCLVPSPDSSLQQPVHLPPSSMEVDRINSSFRLRLCF